MNEGEFQSFLVKNYSKEVVLPPVTNALGFEQKHLDVYTEIHKDVLRSLQSLIRYNQVNNLWSNTRELQAVFENYFICVFMSSTIPTNKYFEGLTDVFEVIFATFANTSEICKNAVGIPVENDDFEPISFTIDKYFSIDFSLLLRISTTIMLKIYQQMNHFSIEFIKEECELIQKIAKQYDESLYTVLREYPNANLLLAKYVISLGSHFTYSLENQQMLIWYYLQLDTKRQAFFIEQTLSVGVRAYCPKLLTSNDRYICYMDLFLEKQCEETDRESMLFDGLSNAFNYIFEREENRKTMFSFYEKILRRYDDWEVGKVVLAGLGIALAAAGVVGSLIAAAVQQKKRNRGK